MTRRLWAISFCIALTIFLLCLLTFTDSAISSIKTSSGVDRPDDLRDHSFTKVFDVLGDPVTLPRSPPTVESLLPPENVPEYRRVPYNVTCADLKLRRRNDTEPIPKIFLFNIYNGEDDHLATKLDEVYPIVDYIVLMESPLTFRGNPKPVTFQ